VTPRIVLFVVLTLTVCSACVVEGITFVDLSEVPLPSRDAGSAKRDASSSAGELPSVADAALPPSSSSSSSSSSSGSITPCAEDRILAGVQVPGGMTADDDVRADEVNAFPYFALTTEIARCARIEIVEAPPAGASLLVGVYNDSGGAPGMRIATGVIAVPMLGWNKVALDVHLALNPATRVWLAVVPQTGVARINLRTDCQLRRRHMGANGNLPTTFVADPAINYCDAAFYLSP
jgi:hypothetical protein